jgi:hypothetical protein
MFVIEYFDKPTAWASASWVHARRFLARRTFAPIPA